MKRMLTDKEYYTLFGKILLLLRKEKGLSQGEVARRVRIDNTSMGKIFRGAIAPRARRLFAILDAMECSPDDLFKRMKENGKTYQLPKEGAPVRKGCGEPVPGGGVQCEEGSSVKGRRGGSS